MKKQYHKETIPFPHVFSKICSNFSITKKECWELLFFLKEIGLIEIVPYHGVRIVDFKEQLKFSFGYEFRIFFKLELIIAFMQFQKRDHEYKVGRFLGYLLMLIVFSIILFFILSFFNKIPESWSYIHILFIAIFLVLIGKGIKLCLEQ